MAALKGRSRITGETPKNNTLSRRLFKENIMPHHDFISVLKNRKIIIIDGAMGTELSKRGLEMSGTNNPSNPDEVIEIHRQYITCGVDVIITNTLTMNRINCESHGINIDIREVNVAGARLEKQAAVLEWVIRFRTLPGRWKTTAPIFSGRIAGHCHPMKWQR
ncbi:MAG: homocysteine S-methyltransferase family protein [Spirochaetales bacterium]|nr:homocysteine S-methyltransferase family protein [Spirochaetales bacterium]